MKIKFLPLALLTTAMSLTWACNPEKVPETETQKQRLAKMYIHSAMQTYYYWNTQLPKSVNYKGSASVEDFFEGLLVGRDRWSWMESGDEYAASESGVVMGTFGASISQPLEYYKDYDVKVRYVIPGSPFDKAGVTRGWTITYINGISKDDLVRSGQFAELFYSPSVTTPETFTFTDTAGKAHEIAITAAPYVNMRPALVADIYDADDYPGLPGKVGYFNYLGFQAGIDAYGKPMMDDIKENMDMFREAGVKYLILDLRYNGGGDSRASDTLINYLAPVSSLNRVYVTRTHNSELRKYDNSYKITRILDEQGRDLSLNLERLYVLTGPGTASASEMLLNGLMPLMDVRQVGDTTYGKPNGMYVLMYPDDDDNMDAYSRDDYSNLEYAFLPICFYNSNGRGENIPDDGLKPGAGYRPDDLYHDFGPDEDNIAACLYHIVNGSYPELPSKTRSDATKASSGRENARLEEEVRNQNYGIFKDIQSEIIPNFWRIDYQ